LNSAAVSAPAASAAWPSASSSAAYLQQARKKQGRQYHIKRR
jgi:hypothetical protein